MSECEAEHAIVEMVGVGGVVVEIAPAAVVAVAPVIAIIVAVVVVVAVIVVSKLCVVAGAANSTNTPLLSIGCSNSSAHT